MEKQEVISEFWAAFLAADEERLAGVVDDGTSWYISGRSRVAGQHVGLAAVLALRRELQDVSGGTFRAGGGDAAAAHHAYLLDLLTVERDGEESSIYVTLVADIPDQKLGLTWLYFEDQYLFDAAFA